MDDPKFDPDGGCYWRGGVWCMMEYMIAEGLAACGLADAAHRLARRHVEAVTEVFRRTGTFWESYSPTAVERNCGGTTSKSEAWVFTSKKPRNTP